MNPHRELWEKAEPSLSKYQKPFRVLALTVGFSPALQWDFGKLPKKDLKCWFVKLTPKPNLAVIAILGLIPLLMNCILYLIILYYALRRIVKLTEADEKGSSTVKDIRISRSGSKKASTKKVASPKWKAIKIVAFTNGAYILTMVPYSTACFLYVTCTDPRTCATIGKLIASPLAILLFLNSLLNPIIYAWWHQPFRTNAKNLILRKKQYSSKSIPSTTSTGMSTRSSETDPEMTHL